MASSELDSLHSVDLEISVVKWLTPFFVLTRSWVPSLGSRMIFFFHGVSQNHHLNYRVRALGCALGKEFASLLRVID